MMMMMMMMMMMILISRRLSFEAVPKSVCATDYVFVTYATGNQSAQYEF